SQYRMQKSMSNTKTNFKCESQCQMRKPMSNAKQYQMRKPISNVKANVKCESQCRM
ncbi:28811_t:CDS:1, partial [Racocetra persica]